MPRAHDRVPIALDRNPLVGLAPEPGKLPKLNPVDFVESVIKIITDNIERIPLIGPVVSKLAELIGLGDDNALINLLKGLVSLDPRNFLDGLAGMFGGGAGLGLPAILSGLNGMFGGLRADGGLDASKLFGALPTGIMNAIRGLLSLLGGNVELGQLIRLPLGQERNWLGTFDTPESVPPGDGFTHDATVGRTAPGSAKVTFDGAEHVRISDPIDVAAGQELSLGGFVRFDGYVGSGGPAVGLRALAYSAGDQLLGSQVIGTVTPSAGSSADFETVMQASWTAPANTAYCYVRMEAYAAGTAGTGHFDDLWLRKPAQSMPQEWITNLVPALGNLGQGVTDAWNFVQSTIDRFMNGRGILGSLFSLSHFETEVSKVFGPGSSIPQANVPIVSDIIKAVTGYTSGEGAPSGSNAIADMLTALSRFTGSTNTTAITADQANGVGSNALTNTVNIQAQLQGVQDVQDAGWTARPLWASMDYTADSSFPLYLMQRQTSHTHTVSATLSGNTQQSPGVDTHTHPLNGSGAAASGTAAASSAEFGAYTFTSGQAYVGFIRCGSVQEKRLFSFRAYYTAAPADFRIDIYRLDKATGTMTLLHTSSNLAGALTTSAQWVQYVIPAGTAGIIVQPGDILGVQFRITSGTVALQGLDSLIPANPPGFLPRRVGMLRTGTISAPATMAESVWSSAAGFVPYVECGVDTGQASAPLSISDNFDGSLSNQWMMSGANEIGIASNNIGILQSGTSLADGWSWGKFNTQLHTDQAEVGITATSTSAEEQVVWFKGSGPNLHVGLAISSSYATLYTMSGGTRTNRVQVAISTVDADYKVRYTASSKVFAVYRNGAQIGSWTDSGNVAPTGLGNRFGGVGLHATRGTWFGLGSTKASPIDNWALADV